MGSIYTKENKEHWLFVKRYYAMSFEYTRMAPHTHNELEIMYVVSGSCTVNHWVKDNEMEQTHLREGEYIVIDRGVKHQLRIEKGVECFIQNLEISIQPVESEFSLWKLYEQSSAVKAFLEKKYPVVTGCDNENAIHTILTSVHRQLQNEEDKKELGIQQNLLLAQLVIELSRQQKRKRKGDYSGKYVEESLAYLLQHFEEDVKIQEIANQVGVTSSHLQRVFKQKTGATLIEKLNEFRMEKAKILLQVTNMPIVDIAASVGYNSRQHFAHTFLLFHGVSPATYRRNNGESIYYKDTEE